MFRYVMKRRYIVSIVAAAILATMYVAYVLYSNLADIREVLKEKVRAEVVLGNIRPQNIRETLPEDLLARAKSDPALTQDLATMNTAYATAVSKIDDISRDTESIVKNESAEKMKQAVPIAGAIIEATKYRKIEDEKKASKEYDDVLRQIEEEKAKSIVLLTGTRTERLKAKQLEIMQSLDMENTIHDTRVVTKKECEKIVRKQNKEALARKNRSRC
jgi:hypothetical protein